MNRFKHLFTIIILFISNSIFAQDWNAIFEYQIDAENYMFDRQFDKAAETFKKALRLVPDNCNFKYKIGYCYLNTDDQKNEAISYLEEASSSVSEKYSESSLKEPNAPIETLFLLAKAYQINKQFDNAAEAYTKFEGFLKPDDKLRALVEQNIMSCKNANNFIKDSVSLKSQNLGKLINNDLPNINAVVSGDGKTLAYTTISKIGNDIYVSHKDKGKWSAPVKINGQLGNKYFLTSSLSFDGKDLYLVTDDPQNADIYVTTYDKNRWIKPLQFKKPINTKANENHACVTKDGNTMYFTSDRKGGLGGYDIYKVSVNEKGVWGTPVNLGPEINTPFNEATPFLSSDEKYLFFSSEGHNSMGGYDVFYVNLEGTPKVVSMGYPVNNSDDNLFYVPENGWKSGYISYYSKKNNFGKDDIYHIDISRYTSLNGKILANANDSDSKFKVSIFDTQKNDTIARLESNGTNGFNYKLLSGNYKIAVKNSKYLPFSEDIDVSGDNKEMDIDAQMQPIPIETPKQITEITTPKVEPVDSSTIKKTVPVVVAENKKVEKVKEQPKEKAKEKTKEKPKEKPREIKKTEEVKKVIPVIKIENSISTGTTTSITTYAVQLMAAKVEVGIDYFKNIDNIEITTTPDGYYRYSVGSTESLDAAMVTLKKVKELGYSRAFIRIDRKEAFFTIQLMALHKPADPSTFANISGVSENKGNDGIYRYQVGNFSSLLDAKKSLVSIYEAGYKNAYIRKIGVK